MDSKIIYLNQQNNKIRYQISLLEEEIAENNKQIAAIQYQTSVGLPAFDMPEEDVNEYDGKEPYRN